jgi:HSP20 family protein
MSTKSLVKREDFLPAAIDDFFKPWNEWFGNGGFWSKEITVPAVNISEDKDKYLVTMAAPGFNKADFNIELEGNMLTISSEKQETKNEKDARFTRKEYSYSSFSRSFSLPEEVNQAKIDAAYEDGVLKLNLPKKEEARKQSVSKHITVK